MNDGVDPTRGDHLGNHGIADVGAYKIGRTQVVTGRDHIEPDDLDVLFSSERADEPGTQVTRDSGDEDDPFRGHHGPAARLLARATALDPSALEQFAMLLLRHPLATLLDDRTHCVTPRSRDVTPVPDLITAGACRRTTPECYRAPLIDASQEGSCALSLSKGTRRTSTAPS